MKKRLLLSLALLVSIFGLRGMEGGESSSYYYYEEEEPETDEPYSVRTEKLRAILGEMEEEEPTREKLEEVLALIEYGEMPAFTGITGKTITGVGGKTIVDYAVEFGDPEIVRRAVGFKGVTSHIDNTWQRIKDSEEVSDEIKEIIKKRLNL